MFDYKALLQNVGLDTRSVAAFRVALSVLTLVGLWPRFNTVNAWWNLLLLLWAMALLIGYRTRLATVCCWLLTLYPFPSNTVPTSHSVWLQSLLFWSVFLPLGTRYSVDNALNTLPGESRERVLSGGVVAYCVQVLVLFCASFTPLGVIALLPFIPSLMWSVVRRRLNTPRNQGLRIYFDGDCRFCRKGVFILREFFLSPLTRVQPAQCEPEIEAEMLERQSWVVVDAESRHFHGFEAVTVLFGHSPLLGPLVPMMRIPPVHRLGSVLYRWVAGHRSEVSTVFTFLVFRPVPARSPWWDDVIPLLLLCASVFSSISA